MKINNIVIIALIILYRLLLDAGYLIYANPVFAYQGFILDLNFIKYVFSFLILFIFAVVFIKESKRISNSIINILFLTMVVPFTSLYGLENHPSIFFLAVIFGFLITALFIRSDTVKTKKLEPPTFLLPMIILISTVLTYGSLFLLNGMPSLTALNVFNVYEVRRSVRYGPGIFEYLFGWQARVINPLLIGYGLWYKRKNLLFVGAVLQLLIYLYTGHKSFLFTPIVVIGVAYLVKKGALLKGALLGLNAIVFTGIIMYKFFEDHFIATLFIRRTLLVPMKNHYIYYDFFSSNEKVYLSHSIFRFFLDYPYQMQIPNIIGSVYYNNPDTWVNVGYLADAYMNFGFIGIIVFSIFLGLILKMFDSLSMKIGVEIVLVTSFMAFFSLISGALLTTLLTGGIILAFVLLTLLSNLESNKIREGL